MTGRIVGTARVRPVRLTPDELTGRLVAWKYLDAARAAAHDGRPYGYSRQAQKDVAILGKILANVLALHEPTDHSPLCPACSTPHSPHLWPCLTWRHIVREFA